MWLTKTRFNEIAFGQYIDIKLEANFSALTAEVNAKELNDILVKLFFLPRYEKFTS